MSPLDVPQTAKEITVMSHNIASLKPLFLTEDEALALLDLSLMSSAENDSTKERAMLKLTDLVRRYLTTGREASEEILALTTDSQPAEPENRYPPVASLLQTLSEPTPASERTFDRKMSEHTGRVFFGRRQRRARPLAYAD
jgi:hypothetical protein